MRRAGSSKENDVLGAIVSISANGRAASVLSLKNASGAAAASALFSQTPG